MNLRVYIFIKQMEKPVFYFCIRAPIFVTNRRHCARRRPQSTFIDITIRFFFFVFFPRTLTVRTVRFCRPPVHKYRWSRDNEWPGPGPPKTRVYFRLHINQCLRVPGLPRRRSRSNGIHNLRLGRHRPFNERRPFTLIARTDCA